MKGIHVINDLNGKPAVLTIDLCNLDPKAIPLVNELLGKIVSGTDYEYASSFETERHEFLQASTMNLNRAYGYDEPDYNDLIEKNPNYVFLPICD